MENHIFGVDVPRTTTRAISQLASNVDGASDTSGLSELSSLRKAGPLDFLQKCVINSSDIPYPDDGMTGGESH